MQLLAIYDVRNVHGKLQKRGYFYLSDNPHHNWSSAVVGYSDYLRRRKHDFASSGGRLQANSLWSDRGPSDQWCAPFMAYAHDIAEREDVLLCQNTSGRNHGKWNHDRIGGNVGNAFGAAYREGKFVVRAGQSPAEAVVAWLRSNMRWGRDKDGNKTEERFFFVIPANAIKVTKSPVKTLDIGIKQYHCMVSRKKKIYFRKYSCSCSECLRGIWEKCMNMEYCGPFQRTWFRPYRQYNQLESRYGNDGNKRKKQRVDGN